MKKVTELTRILLLVVLLTFLSCSDDPTAPEHINPFDRNNPSTGGNPFQLTAKIANGGITLDWAKPDFDDLNKYGIHRSENQNNGYVLLETVSKNVLVYTDQNIENGHSYWYKVTAINTENKETDITNAVSININSNPVISIEGGSAYTIFRNVSLTILAKTATEMIISENSDFQNAVWEEYATLKQITLKEGPGEKVVFLKVKYGDGIESAIISDTISPQPINPQINIEDGNNYTATRNVKIKLSAEGTNLQMKISEDSTFSSIGWENYSTEKDFQLSEGEGKKAVYVIYLNDFEIESERVSDSITIDLIPPIPVLSVSPDSGIANETYFRFYPTSSSDNYASNQELKVRFDWENDGNYDTDWIHLSVTDFRYILGGGDKSVKMQITEGVWLADTIVSIFVNTRPMASFIAINNDNTPAWYHFDASSSSDYEDGTNLQYRWDFDGDGEWDTGYSMIDTNSYKYLANGDYNPKLSVRDQNYLSLEKSKLLSVFNGTLTDIDGNVYQAVKIGNQWWMAENLKVTRYRNGDAIPNVTDATEWSNLKSGAYCDYDNNPSNVATYGRLYNWYAIKDSREIAPAGWHVPSDEEWKQLEKYLGMSQVDVDNTGLRGTDEGDKLKSTSGWNEDGNGSNESGFTVLPGGYRSYNGAFGHMGNYGLFWSSTETNSTTAWLRFLGYSDSGVDRSNYDKPYGISVRCVRD